MQHPFKLRNSKCCLASSWTFNEYSSDLQRLWSDCAHAQAGLSLCWSRIPHCWKSHVRAQLCSSVIKIYDNYADRFVGQCTNKLLNNEGADDLTRAITVYICLKECFLSLYCIILALTPQNLSSNLEKARLEPGQSPQLHRLSRNFACSKPGYDNFQKAINTGADQTAQVRRLVCACVIRKLPKTCFLASRHIFHFTPVSYFKIL